LNYPFASQYDVSIIEYNRKYFYFFSIIGSLFTQANYPLRATTFGFGTETCRAMRTTL